MVNGIKKASRAGCAARAAARDYLEGYCDESLEEIAFCLLEADFKDDLKEARRGALIEFIAAHGLSIYDIDKIIERGALSYLYEKKQI
jgi:hypothetical protein